MLRIFGVIVLLFPFAMLSQSAPEEFGGLQIWLRSDTGLVVTELGKIESWADLSGNDNHATQTTNNFRPNLFENVLLGKPSVGFDGVNDWLTFPEQNDIRSVFWVIKEHEDATISGRCLLGHDSEFDFFRGPNYNMWHADFASVEVLEGVTRLNFSEIEGPETTVPNDFSIISVVTSGNTSASRITLDRNLFTNVWDGELLELAIFNQPLESEEVESIEAYLAERYSPEFSVSEDVQIEYGFCDTTLCASPGFQSYLWSTGEQESCISVNNTGQYWVQVSDSFGRIVSDTVDVEFPGTTNIPDQFFCSGDEVLLDTGLDNEFYDVSWNGEPGLPAITISQGGSYILSVQDTLGCILEANTINITEDMFPVEAGLGEDISLCEGNILELNAEGYEVVEYLWNDEFEEQSIEVSISGEYWIEATDVFGCVVQDTIDVEIVGTAPSIAFDTEGMCLGDEMQFFNETTSEDLVDQWLWEFGDGQFSTDQNPSHEYEFADDFVVTLQATTVVGCFGEISASVHVFKLPDADFSHDLLCSGWPAQFIDESTTVEGDIISWVWTIYDEQVESSDLVVTLENPGFELIELEVTTVYGCVDVEQRLIEILASPEVTILSEGSCLGDFVEFDADIVDQESGPIETFFWTFGDGTLSFEPSPNHLYFIAGTYFTSIIVTAENGCEAAHFLTIDVFDPPHPDFFTENLCVGQAYTLIDLSHSDSDPIVEWNWVIEDYGMASGPAPEIVLDDVGFYSVELTVVTENGCAASETQVFPVFELPIPAFSYDPIIEAPPAEITFTNLSAGADPSYVWDFGEGIPGSTEANPVVNFLEAGLYMVVLQVTNVYGCVASTSVEILIDDPVLDLVIQNVTCEETNAGMQIWVSVSNQGNFPLSELDLFWNLAGESAVHEQWQGQLLPGGLVDFLFSSGPVPGLSSEPVLCVEVDAFYTGYTDANPTNNILCKTLGVVEELTVLPLFPNPALDEISVDLLLPAAGEFTLLIYDARGRKVIETLPIFGFEGFNRVTVGVGQLLQATYYLEVRSKSAVEVLGFLKE